MTSNFLLDPDCTAKFTEVETYEDMRSFAFLKSSCSGWFCSKLPRKGDASYLKSLTSGRMFSSMVWAYGDFLWHYPETDSTFTTAEGNGDWCYYTGDFIH